MAIASIFDHENRLGSARAREHECQRLYVYVLYSNTFILILKFYFCSPTAQLSYMTFNTSEVAFLAYLATALGASGTNLLTIFVKK